MVIIKKNTLELKINELGAEMKSFCIDGIEFLWNKDLFWKKTSPVLFPFVGGLRENKYVYNNKEYFINTRHGFARDNIFDVKNKTEDSATFMFKSNEETYLKYPFKFELYIKYTLINNGFIIEYLVKNLENKDMYFSLGAHPAFILDNDYENSQYLEFEKKESAKKFNLEQDGFFRGFKPFFSLMDKKNIIPIKEEFFLEDAIAFKGLNSNIVSLKSKKTSKSVTVNYTGFKYIAFWKVKDAPFICIEPWYGITDINGTNNDIKNKEGIEKISSNSHFKASLVFTFTK